MKPLWLLGADIAASPSPAMHNAALVALGMEPVYALRPCTSEELPTVLDEAERTCRGINVTAPHKLAAAKRFAAVLDDDARVAGAVNTVVFDEVGGTRRAVAALNTDIAGLLFAWRRAGFHVEGHTIGVVGAGGAARAVVIAAKHAGARGVVVHARRAEAAASLVALAATIGLDGVAADRPCDASLAVLATTTLDDPEAWISRALDRRAAVHDLRYGLKTRPARDAALRAGHLFADGSWMLLGQAEAALAALTGAPLPEAASTAMRRALSAALAG